MAEPLVSVVMATYQRPHLLLERSLPSILAQTHQNLEVIVVGDGPNPGAQAGIEELDDDRVRYTEVPKQELPKDPGSAWCVLGLDARNKGWDEASGGYIMGMDDDDEWFPYTVKLLLAQLLEMNADVAYGRSKRIAPDGSIGWHGVWPPGHFAYCEGAYIAKHDLGFRMDPECIKRGLPEDGDKIDRMVAAGVRFTFLDVLVHNYYANRQ